MVASPRVMYIEGFSGVAGDMLLGALIDAGLPVDALRAALGTLGVSHELAVSRTTRAGVSATRVEVRARSASEAGTESHAQPNPANTHGHSHGHGHDPHSSQAHHHHHGHRSFSEIAHLIGRSALSPAARDRAVKLVRRIAEAEAAIHEMPLDEVQLHEVGATDSIIDIVGVVFGMEWLGIDEVVASPLNVGGGTVEMAHGRYPVPAPATLRLLANVPVYNGGPNVELVTPTGALLVTDYASSFGPMPAMVTHRVGYGAGTRDFTGVPNVVRVLVGERVADAVRADSAVLQMDCEIDDMNPQLFGPVVDQLEGAGALDVFLTPVQMKKGRPGTLLTVLLAADRRRAVSTVVFRETTTIGVRFHSVDRETLDRDWKEVVVAGGVVRIKVASRHGTILNASPEFDDCVRIATATGQPVKSVQAAAMRAWLETSSK